MILDKFKRLLRTDFEEQFQDLIDKLAFSINNTLESVVDAFNNKISLKDNIQCTLKSFAVVVDSSGTPINSVSFQMTIPNKPIGILCLNAQNLTNNTAYSNSGITVYWSLTGKTVIINNITGLIANNKYQLTLVAFG